MIQDAEKAISDVSKTRRQCQNNTQREVPEPDRSELCEVQPVPQGGRIGDHAWHDSVVLESHHVNVEAELFCCNDHIEEDLAGV